jgi:phage gpG-like protein
MAAIFKVNASDIQNLGQRFDNLAASSQIKNLAKEKGIAALIGQAIAENFAKEGPGWAPLKAQTIRSSLAKKLRKSLSQMTNKQLLTHEKMVRRKGSTLAPLRMILQKTGLLKMSVTTPGAQNNIFQTEGNKIVWGTNLVYAAIHNHGSKKNNIPKRTFLKISSEWKTKLFQYALSRAKQIISEHISR